jgi:hypothetical protein
VNQIKKSLAALLLLYNTSNSQLIKSEWEVKVPFFVKNSTEAVLEYDLDKNFFNGHTNLKFTLAGSVMSFFTTSGPVSNLEVDISSNDTMYHERFKEWGCDYDVSKKADGLHVNYKTKKRDKSYILSNKWTDAGQAFVEIMKAIKDKKYTIGSRVPYSIHSNGDTLSVNIDFIKSDSGYDYCAKITAQNGKKLFDLTKEIRVDFIGNEPYRAYTQIYLMHLIGKRKSFTQF